MLFLQHMISKMRPADSEGSRIAIVMNGSPLFTGDAGSGESEIRRWILENDWLDAIIVPAGATLLQHRHQHLRLDIEQQKDQRQKRQGTTD